VICEKAIARPPIIRPMIGRSTSNRRRGSKRCVSTPPRITTLVTTATAIASAIVHPDSPTRNCPAVASWSGPSAYALVLNPVNDPIPSETSVPIPAASSPGTSTSRSLGPPIAVASIRITAAISGEAKMNESAEKLPAARLPPAPALACRGATG
jgi:hypothetical protein